LEEITSLICFRQWENTGKNLRGKWQEKDLQIAMRVVKTSKLSANGVAIHYKLPRMTLLERIWQKTSRVDLNWGGKLYFYHSRRKGYPRALLGSLKLGAP
jgi:hypothetical protein